jgi:hypothetical protein
MSDATRQAVEEALAAHLDDEMDGVILTAWWVTMAGSAMDRPGETAYHYDGPQTQPFHVTYGLDRMSTRFLDKEYGADDD